MADSDVFELVKASLDCYVPLPAEGLRKGKEETYEDILEMEALMQLTGESLKELFTEILVKDPTPDGLDSIFKVISVFRTITFIFMFYSLFGL